MKSIARLVIAGSGSAKESLMKMAISNPYIEFWDVPAGKVPNVQAKADVMILPIKKGFALSSIPSKLPAYMFSSKRVICAVDNNSDTAKCITEAGGGWVVEPENIEVLAMRLEECLNIPDESLVEMGARNFQYAIENFSRELGVKKLVSVFKEALYK